MILNAFGYLYRGLKSDVMAVSIEDKIIEEEKIIDEIKTDEEFGGTNDNEDELWQVEIPSIELIATISEGTSQDVLLDYVGHFENTSIWNGNVGLAAHNRGYPINYFARLKELETGDEIIYKTKYGKRTYSVNTIVTIEDTDWSYLQLTDDNVITLITCVENKPSKRLCVRATQIKEE